MAGIIEEQHPDRARLFMKWKRMDWPILVDSLDRLNIGVVPLTIAIDEYGIVRRIHIPLAEAVEFSREFAAQKFEPPTDLNAPQPERPDLDRLRAAASSAGTVKAWRDYGDALFVWAGSRGLNSSIEAYLRASLIDPRDKMSRFRLGVAYRRRYDSDIRKPDDFQNAIDAWQQALDLDPNQYIFRRRIQQYGPRLAKPYPFYDWVPKAREEIIARGETPPPLQVEPRGSEFARPEKTFHFATVAEREPDPEGRITRDHGEFVHVEATAVPSAIAPGQSARFHLVFRPNLKTRAHWNNEADGMVVWLNPPGGWSLDERSVSLPNPPEEISREVRDVEFEAKSPDAVAPGPATLSGYALYYVCEDVDGTCLYRRQDISAEVTVR